MIRTLLFIGTGGFLGTVSRFLISKYSHQIFQTTFPFGTLIVNLTGCFVLGLIYGIMERGDFMTSDIRLSLTVGFCGGFTTFSTFALENASMLKDGNTIHFLIYTFVSVIIGTGAFFAGGLSTKLI